MHCPWCSTPEPISVYRAPLIPIFQNKAYTDQEDAHHAVTGSVDLLACNACGYVWNSAFDATLMRYDESYQNEQAHSPAFDSYLDALIPLFEDFREKSIVEIGCGKGTFLEKLWSHGFNAIGFDTAYEGSDPRVRKEYFGEQHKHLAVDLIILRHTLEHIADPLSFLQTLASLTQPHTKIYIEVPALEWILERKAFWDIFYEHCNYFTLQCLSSAFLNPQSGYLFGNQYMYVLADLRSLRQSLAVDNAIAPALSTMQCELVHYRRFVEQHKGLYVWGAGAKGATFASLTDPLKENITALIDINPKKSGYLALTGHPIILPEQISKKESVILVMNENYADEIKQTLACMELRFEVFTLGLLCR